MGSATILPESDAPRVMGTGEAARQIRIRRKREALRGSQLISSVEDNSPTDTSGPARRRAPAQSYQAPARQVPTRPAALLSRPRPVHGFRFRVRREFA